MHHNLPHNVLFTSRRSWAARERAGSPRSTRDFQDCVWQILRAAPTNNNMNWTPNSLEIKPLSQPETTGAKEIKQRSGGKSLG